ncbi:pyridoxal phosphate-dependent transferase [Xylogone sp. PMI_703]|nr:pyridoxal phosphate-dependent transferase [Xylogone sp. PMI_703]
MSTKITTQPGYAVPPALPHSVTVHMGDTWQSVEKYCADPSTVIAQFKNAYPRMKIHGDIVHLARAVLKHLKADEEACLIFSSLQSAIECVEFITAPERNSGIDKRRVLFHEIRIRAFSAKDHFFAVSFPTDKLPIVTEFWSISGVGISSRFAKANLDCLDQLTEVDLPIDNTPRSNFEANKHEILRGRIIQNLNRAPLNPNSQIRPSTEDVYLYPSGMASIYKAHSYLLDFYHGTTVLFGMAFMSTIKAFQEFGSNFKFFGLGTDDELHDLEIFLQDERKHGRKVQAIWAEFPANPTLVTPNITKLHNLAREYGSILAIDDTVGSFANIDIMSMTDILVTSLSKSFNGYADVIAGSLVLNPASPKYNELKNICNKYYIPELYTADAVVIEQNSRDYLLRTTKLNHNANSLVQYLHSCTKNSRSAIRKVYYPSIDDSGKYYKQFMRPATSDFTSGYGCLFSIEFEDLPTTIAFYDNLNVHKGPHLGAPFTLAAAYIMCAYANSLDWAAKYGLKQTQIRISAGLEDTSTLLKEFKIAVDAANRVKAAAVTIGPEFPAK